MPFVPVVAVGTEQAQVVAAGMERVELVAFGKDMDGVGMERDPEVAFGKEPGTEVADNGRDQGPPLAGMGMQSEVVGDDMEAGQVLE